MWEEMDKQAEGRQFEANFKKSYIERRRIFESGATKGCHAWNIGEQVSRKTSGGILLLK